MLQQISESELVLMKVIWKYGGTALYSCIMNELEQDKNEWKKNTVLTLLSRLAEKGFLKIGKIGRRNEYIALISETEYRKAQTQNFLDKVYGGSVKGLVATLLQQDIISSDELRDIEEFWRKANE